MPRTKKENEARESVDLATVPIAALWLILSQKLLHEGVPIGLRNTMSLQYEGEWHVSRTHAEPVIEVVDSSNDQRRAAIRRQMEVAEAEYGKYTTGIRNREIAIEDCRSSIAAAERKEIDLGIRFEPQDRKAYESLIVQHTTEKERLEALQSVAKERLDAAKYELMQIPDITSYHAPTDGPLVIYAGSI